MTLPNTPDLYSTMPFYKANPHLAAAQTLHWDLLALTRYIHDLQVAKGWWLDPSTCLPIQRNVGELLMLCVSELAEAMEGHRKNLPDDKLPTRPMLEVELADCLIRIFDMAGGLGLDLAGALVEKLEFNWNRPDHSLANRAALGGKKY